MEVNISLRRTQSLKNVSPGHVRSWTEAGLWERRKSVSQLVALYQYSVKARTTSQEETQKDTSDGNVPQIEESISDREETQTSLESLLKRNELRKRLWEQSSHTGSANFSRSRSMENLPKHRPGSISALQALFESKAVFQKGLMSTHKHSSTATSNKMTVTQTVNGNAEEESSEDSKTQSCPTTVDKMEEIGQKDVNMDQSERRRTISSVFLEKSQKSQDDEKRRSLLDQKDINSFYGQDKPSASVKALSALYLSKVSESKGKPSKPECAAQDHIASSDKKNKTNKDKMADLTHNINVAKGISGVNAGKYSSLPSQSIHQVEDSLSSAESKVVLPICPPKESFSEFYQRRQKIELKRLYRHTHPELKALSNVIDKELEEVLNSEDEHTATNSRYQGDVLSMRWMFENWTQDDSHHRDLHTAQQPLEEISKGEKIKGISSMFEQQKSGTDQYAAAAGLPKKDCNRKDFYKRPDQAGMEAEKWNEPILVGDVKGMSLLMGSTALDPPDYPSSVEDHSFTKLRSEIQEQRREGVNALNLFKVKPSCALCGRSGNMHKIKSMCKDQLRAQHRTPSPDKSIDGVHIFQCISLEEDWKDGVDGDRQRWMVEGQALDADRQVSKEDKYQGTIDTVKEGKQKLFETQPLAARKGLSHSEHTVSKKDIVGADVRSISGSFETQPGESNKDSSKLRCGEKVIVSGHEREPVMKMKHVCEPASLNWVRQGNIEGESTRNTCRIELNDNMSGDVKCGKALFETSPVKDCSSELDQLEEGKINLKLNRGRKIFNSESKEEPHSTESQSKQSSTLYSENEKVGSKHETEPDEPVENEQISALQAAIQRLRQATDEARSIEHSVLEKQHDSVQKALNQPGRAVPISTVNDVVQRSEQEKDSDVVARGDAKVPINVLPGSTIQQPVDEKEIAKGSFQAALRSLEKASINISKGDFKAAMIYRNSGKSSLVQNKKEVLHTLCKQTTVEPLPPSHTELSHSGLLMTDELSAVKRTAVEGHSSDKSMNTEHYSSTLSNQPQNPLPFHPRPANQKPAIPPKPDHLKSIRGHVTRSVPVHNKRPGHPKKSH